MPENSKTIELSILEPLGIDRPAYPITTGVPFPQGGVLRTETNLRVESGRKELPLQTRTLLAWPDGSIKWVLLDFQTDLEAGKDNRCHLFYGDEVSSTEKAEHEITIEQDEDRLTVTTGPLAFSVDSIGTFPLRSVACNGRTIVPEGALRSEISVDGRPYELRVTSLPVLEEAGSLRAVVKGGWKGRLEGRRRELRCNGPHLCLCRTSHAADISHPHEPHSQKTGASGKLEDTSEAPAQARSGWVHRSIERGKVHPRAPGGLPKASHRIG